MKYNSTIGDEVGLTFRQALFHGGFTAGGGLLLPETIPRLSAETIEQWQGLNYSQLVFEICQLYVTEDEIPREDLKEIINKGLSTFSKEEVLPIKVLNNGTMILEMFHGKTWAFKDLALSCVGQLIAYFAKEESSGRTIIVGTSGDTGSAVLEAVRGLDNIKCIVILPKNRCSQVQERQMTSVISDNVHVFRLDGSSDDLDEPIKACFRDTEFVEKYRLMSCNSINWSRIMIQIAHHFYAYYKTRRTVGEVVEIVIPTGAMGNLISGLVAHQMGLPVRFVTSVTADNDVVDQMLKTGDVIIQDCVIDTMAKALNIGNPYNIQRLMKLFGASEDQIKKFNLELDVEKRSKIPCEILTEIRRVVSSYRGDDDVIKRTIKRCHDENGYVICPHTALAVAYCYHKIDGQTAANDGGKICYATASPYKFREAVLSAGISLETTEAVRELMEKPVRYEDMDKGKDWLEMLKRKIIEMNVI